MPILQITGTLAASQFWPSGTSDADTVKVRVKRVTFAGRPSQCLDNAIDKHGQVTVRLEGIDAPELHYRPQVKAAKQFRQPIAESATVALRELLVREEVRCRVPGQVNYASDVFDCYGLCRSRGEATG